MEEVTHLVLCINMQLLITFIIISVIGGFLWTIHSLEKRQTVIEDKLLARIIARKFYHSLQKEKKV